MVDQEQVLERLDTIFSRIGRLMRRQVADDSLTYAQFAVLRILFREGPLAMGAIADRLAISLAGATGLIDRLVVQGVVQRTRSREDRRVVWVELSQSGRRRMHHLQDERHQQMKHLLKPLNGGEIETLLTLLEKISESVEDRNEANG